MKKSLIYAALSVILVPSFIACEEQNEPEALVIQVPDTKPEAYYEALRAYKKTEHPLAFGWFGNWTATGAAKSTHLKNAPDSMDIISIWGNYSGLTEEMIADKEYVQSVKGTKIIFTIFAHEVPEVFVAPSGKIDYDGYASSLNDTITKYGYDGIDFDYEPNYGGTGPLCIKDSLEKFIIAMSKYVGPKSGTGKLLCIDGEPYYMNEGLAEYFDYGIVQSYNSDGDRDLQSRFDKAYAVGWRPEQYIFTENFESYWQTGGNPNFVDKDGNVMPSLEGMARFNPEQGEKAGVGTYHMEYEYLALPNYKYLRQAIQIMNPTVK